MARAETGFFRHPIESTIYAMHDTPAWLGRHWKPIALTLATLGGAGMAVSQLARPHTPDTQARNTTPVLDPVKPPEERVGIVVVDNPPTHPAPAVAKNIIVEQSTISPLEQAIKAGRIELSGPKDWEKYFVAITPQEAQQFLSDTANKDKMLLPFDPRNSPNLVIENFEWNTPTGNHRAFLGLKNLGVGTIFYASVPGIGTPTRGVLENMLSASGKVRTENDTYSFSLSRASVESLLPYDKQTPVELGDPIMEVVSVPELLPFYQGGGVYQAVGGMGRNSSIITEVYLTQLLTASNRFAFIPQGRR